MRKVLDAMFSKARYLSKIGDWDAAYAAYGQILAKPKTSTAKKIDANMEMARMALMTQVWKAVCHCFHVPILLIANAQDNRKIKDFVTEAKKLVEIGGDWDRRNRLKV